MEFDFKHQFGVWGEHGFHVGSGLHVESGFQVQNWVCAHDNLLTNRFELVSRGGKDKEPYVNETPKDQDNCSKSTAKHEWK